MDLGISGRVALVGASGRGLGRATAERLAMEGAHVALCDIDEEVLDEASRIVQAAGDGATVRSYQVDLRNRWEIEGLVKNVRNDLGPISILITNAGGPPAGAFEDFDEATWQHAVDLSFMSHVRLIRGQAVER